VLKNHPFFEGVDWKNLRGETPPKLVLEPMVRQHCFKILCAEGFQISFDFFVFMRIIFGFFISFVIHVPGTIR